MPSTPALGIGGAAWLSGRAFAVGPRSECVDESGEAVLVLDRLEMPGDDALAAVLTGWRSAGGLVITVGEGGGIGTGAVTSSASALRRNRLRGVSNS